MLKGARLINTFKLGELVQAVLKLREEYPRWGKDKLVILLEGKGISCSGLYSG